MRLDHDCIRDILLYIEENTTDEHCFVNCEKLIGDLFKYDEDTINYHVRKIHQAGLVDTVSYGDGVPQDISSLSWDGHSYVDNIRDNKVWSAVKERTKGLASVTFSIIVECAKSEVKKLLHLS